MKKRTTKYQIFRAALKFLDHEVRELKARRRAKAVKAEKGTHAQA